MISRRLPLTVTVTVSGGTGTTTVTNGTGVVAAYAINAPSSAATYAINAPSAAATYDIELLDADQYGYSGRNANTGDVTIKDLFMADGTITIKITGTDGSYSVRIWFLY